MPGQLIGVIPLKNIGTSVRQVNNYLELAGVSGKMKRGPLLYATRDVEVEELLATLSKFFIEIDHCVHPFLLPLTNCSVQRSPVVVILLVNSRTI